MNYTIRTDTEFFGKSAKQCHETTELKYFAYGVKFKVKHYTSAGQTFFYTCFLPYTSIIAIEER